MRSPWGGLWQVTACWHSRSCHRRAGMLTPVTIYRHHLPVGPCRHLPQRTSQGAAVCARTHKGVCPTAGGRQAGVRVGMEPARGRSSGRGSEGRRGTPSPRRALGHQYAQPIAFITFFDLTQKNVTC
jgi:hypothetical protein